MYLEEEGARLETERASLAEWEAAREGERRKFLRVQEASVDWTRYMLCNSLPDPTSVAEINDYLNRLKEANSKPVPLEGALDMAINNEAVVAETQDRIFAAQSSGEAELAERYEECIKNLQQVSSAVLDQASASLLQSAEDYLDDHNEVHICMEREKFKFGLWVNLFKNPRMKVIDLPSLNILAEVPKSIALSSTAMRFLSIPYDEYSRRCTNELVAVGNIFLAEILSLPAAPKRTNGWVMRQVTPLLNNVQRLPYPIPPAGATTAAPMEAGGVPGVQGGDEVPPIRLTLPLSKGIVVLDDGPKVGWWDEGGECWRTEGISDVQFDSEKFSLSFNTVCLTKLALLQSRVFLMPYKSWFLCPQGGKGGDRLLLTLNVSNFSESFQFEVSNGEVALLKPELPQASEFLRQPMAPRALLHRLQQIGLNLMPLDKDSAYVETVPKSAEVEALACNDVAMLADGFMVASSKWNNGTGETTCLYRVSEVLDFGRTRLEHAHRIFSKEKTEGPRSTMCIARTAKGVTFADSLESAVGSRVCCCQEKYACSMNAIDHGPSLFNERRYSPLHLLAGSPTAEVAGSEAAAHFGSSAETREHCKASSALTGHALVHLMLALRLFSFS